MKYLRNAVIMLAVCALLAACGTTAKESTVLTVNGTPIGEWRFTFTLNQIKIQAMNDQIIDDEQAFWNKAVSDGKTMRDLVVESAVKSLTREVVIDQMAKKESVALTTDDLGAIDGYIKAQKDQGGEAEFNQWLTDNDITEQQFKELYQTIFKEQKLYEKLSADVTEQEMLDYYNGMVRVKHILRITSDAETGLPLSQSEKDTVRSEMEAIYNNAASGTDFDELVAEHSEDPGSFSNPSGYLVGKNSGMVKAFEDASLALDMDELSPIIETEYGYHIIKRVENPESDFEPNKDAVKSAIVENLLASELDKATVDTNDELVNECFDKKK